MKLTIAYNPENEEERMTAYTIATFAQHVLDRLPGKIRVKEGNAHPPLHHIYISVSTRAPEDDGE